MHVSRVAPNRRAPTETSATQSAPLPGAADIDVVSASRRKVAQHRLEGEHNNCSSSVNARYAARVPTMNGRTIVRQGYGTAKY